MAYAERSKTTNKQTGRWLADAEYDIGNGTSKRHHKAYASKGEAELVEMYFRKTGELPPQYVAGPSNSYAKVAAEWTATRDGREWLAKHDEQTNAQRLAFSVTHLGAYDVKHIRKDALDKYRDKVLASAGRGGKGPSNRTVNRYLDAVAKVMRYADAKDLLPMGMPDVPRMKNTGEKRDALTVLQQNKILRCLEAADPDVAFLTRILFMTGVRPGEELLTTRAEQIELPEQRENTGFELTREQTKTDATRWVPLLPVEARKLKAFIAAGKMPDAAHLYNTFKDAVRTSGESSRVSPYWCRHSTYTRLLESGATLLDADILIGHSNKMVSAGYYHPTRAHLFKVAEKVQMLAGEIPNTGEIVDYNSFAKRAESA